jgi:hypothetical protein
LLTSSKISATDVARQPHRASNDFYGRHCGVDPSRDTHGASSVFLRENPVLPRRVDGNGGCRRVDFIQDTRRDAAARRYLEGQASGPQTQKPRRQDIQPRELVHIQRGAVVEQQLQAARRGFETVAIHERYPGVNGFHLAVTFNGCETVNEGYVRRRRGSRVRLLRLDERPARSDEREKSEQSNTGAGHDVPQRGFVPSGFGQPTETRRGRHLRV